MVAELIICILVALILVSYLLYPLTALGLGALVKEKPLPDELPEGRVFLFMSAHNEASVIGRKLASIAEGDFPPDRLFCFIGLDDCSDGTAAMVEEYQTRLSLTVVLSQGRMGKPAMVNALVERARSAFDLNDKDVFLMTDANVLFHPAFISTLMKAFADPATGLADGLALHPEHSSGIARSESTYLRLESALKHAEGKLWGCAMGPFGGAYMLRSHLYRPVPANFLVDDFFIFFNVLRQGYKARVIRQAICYEHVGGSMQEEFRRKVRISAGNFQNAAYFLPGLLRFWKPYNLVFAVHKGLRWKTPLAALCILVLLLALAPGNPLALLALGIMISLLLGIPLLNYLLNQVNLRSGILQGITYFIAMNVAMLLGFFKYLKGIRSNVWEPTKRNL